MDFKYQKIKKLDIKKWLLGGNASIYAIILIVFLAAVIFVFATVRSNMQNSEQNQEPASETQTQTDESTGYVESNQLYRLKINKSQNFMTVYKMNQNREFTEVYKVFRCSVHADVAVGEVKITEKYAWRRLDNNVYGHYTSRLSNGAYIHSVPYQTQDISKLNVAAYNLLGKTAQVGSIYLNAENAKWIYENCGIDADVEIYENTSESPPLSLGEFETLASGTRFDPTDENAVKNNVNTKIHYMTGIDDCTTPLNTPFDQWKGVYAVDVNGTNITSYITISGEVDITKEGTYTLIYYLSDNYGTNLAYYRYVTVVAQ